MATVAEQAALDSVAAIEADGVKVLKALGVAKADVAKAKEDLATAQAQVTSVTDELAAANTLTAEQAATIAEADEAFTQVSQRLSAVDASIDDAVPDDEIVVEPTDPTPVEDLPPA